MAEQELYLRVKAGLPRSDEALILARHLEDRRAWSYVVEMWDWFVEKHPEGQVVGPEAAYLIASGSGWQGDADKFIRAMVLAGYLAAVPEGWRCRGWEKWAGYHLRIRARDKAKKQASRGAESEGCPLDVPGMSQGQSPGCPGDSLSSSISVSVSASEGVQGEAAPRTPPRPRLVSPYPDGQDPHPLTTAVLAALLDRGFDAAPPAARSAARVEAAIEAATLPVAIERLAAVYADPAAKKPLTFHTDAIRGAGQRPPTHGDLGVELHPWPSRLTPEQKAAARAELAALHPDLVDAPLGITGVPGLHPVEAIAELNERWRAVAEKPEVSA